MKPCGDLDEASRQYNAENLELWKEKMKHLEPRMWYDEQLRKEEIRSLGWNNNKNYVMRILHQVKLMTSNGFGILLILVERIKRDIAQAWEGIDGTTGGIETMKEWMITKEENSWTNHRKNWKWK